MTYMPLPSGVFSCQTAVQKVKFVEFCVSNIENANLATLESGSLCLHATTCLYQQNAL